MKLISHRANQKGPNTASFGENHPKSIEEIILKGFDVEIDLWYVEGAYVLGHDQPQYEVTEDFLRKPELWIHCKDITTLNQMCELSHKYPRHLNYFFHQNDDCTLTSLHYIWTFPNHQHLLTPRSIAVLPESTQFQWDVQPAFGICTDYLF